jgi:pSer/pThr/pTyr-binding forkhead associated (FHA) protein
VKGQPPETRLLARERLALVWERQGESLHVAIPEVGTLSVGRDADCDVSFPDSTLSRRHALVLGRRGRAYLRHLSRTNATYVNGRFVHKEVELHAGDELWLPVAMARVVLLSEVEAEET